MNSDKTRPATPREGPDIMVPVARAFGIDVPMQVPAYSRPSEYTPEIDPDYCFDRRTTVSILAGFAYDRRVLIHGYHGTGKSSHIAQVAARLNWPCTRVNLDSEISRSDLVGRDVVRERDGERVSVFEEGALAWAVANPAALILDEYDAGRPDVLFVIQQLLEMGGQLALPGQNRSIAPHKGFRLFATANTVGLGDPTGLYAGTHRLNQAQLDRWSVVTRLDYLPRAAERAIITKKLPEFATPNAVGMVEAMLDTSDTIRRAFVAGDLRTVMSPRGLLAWAENTLIFDDAGFAFEVSFLNRCAAEDRDAVAGHFHQAFGYSPASDPETVTLV